MSIRLDRKKELPISEANLIPTTCGPCREKNCRFNRENISKEEMKLVDLRKKELTSITVGGAGKDNSFVLDNIRNQFVRVFERELAVDALVELVNEELLISD